MSSSLYNFFSYTIEDGKDLMLSPSEKHSIVITQVSIADPSNFTKRVICLVDCETLQIDKPTIDNELQAVNYSSVIASFCPGSQLTKQVSYGFNQTDIFYIKAVGGSITVSG